MRVQNAHIRTLHIHLPAAPTALLSTPGNSLQEGQAFAPATRTFPAIGAPWPGVDGIYAGIARAEDGHPDEHLVLLNTTPGRRMPHADGNAWADALGDGAHMPGLIEGALLAANLRAELKAEKWIWLRPQYSASFAWFQGFSYGGQTTSDVSAEGGVRAVRRFSL